MLIKKKTTIASNETGKTGNVKEPYPEEAIATAYDIATISTTSGRGRKSHTLLL